jgi:hypothetical protein
MLLMCLESFVFQSVVQNIGTKICGNAIVAVVLYGCKTWCLTLREEHRMRVFEVGC